MLNHQKKVHLRLLNYADAPQLSAYLHGLSTTSKKRFAPHSFDDEHITYICQHADNSILRYIATDENQQIIAYMLIKKGMNDYDRRRCEEAGLFLEESQTVTFAPSVADSWQGSGIGTYLLDGIIKELKTLTIKYIVLWGGVQASNDLALRFYEKNGFRRISNFWHEGIENYNMVKTIL